MDKQKAIEKINHLINLNDSFKLKNSEYIKKAQLNNTKERLVIYSRIESELSDIKDEIDLLKNTVEKNYDSMFMNFQFFNQWMFLNFQLSFLNPDDYYFPLRYFASSFSAKSYLNAKRLWESGATRSELILAFNKVVKKASFYKTIKSYFEYIEKESISQDRREFIGEMQKSFSSKLFLSTTLVAITQTEGILWDFANYVNSDDFKIYYTKNEKFYPFLYDSQKQIYKKSNDRLLSIRALLLKTRLGEIFPFDLYTYLISEFYDDRNPLSHGNIKDRNIKVDAISSLLCFYSVLHFLRSYKLSKNEFLGVLV